MALPNPSILSAQQMLLIQKELSAAIERGETLPTQLFETPPHSAQNRFGRPHEVHAQRARKLRRRGESVYFLRWSHGHCIYGWDRFPKLSCSVCPPGSLRIAESSERARMRREAHSGINRLTDIPLDS